MIVTNNLLEGTVLHEMIKYKNRAWTIVILTHLFSIMGGGRDFGDKTLTMQRKLEGSWLH